jgi:hypothetical protein
MKVSRHLSAILLPALVVLGICLPVSADAPWPAEAMSQAVNLTSIEGPGTNDFYSDMSGAFWNPVTRRLWVCRNGPGGTNSKFWAIREDGSGGFEIDYKNGNRGEWTNFGDLEDITQADLSENVVYLIIEGEDRVKEYDVSTYGTAVLRNNWATNINLPAYDGSRGAEGIAFVPDSYLSAAGFVDQSGTPYVSHNGMGGLMFIAHQNGGRLYAFDLNRSNGTFTFVGAYLTGYGESCALTFDRSQGLLYIFHGADHNTTEVVRMSSSVVGSERKISQVVMYASPGGGNLEGIALVPDDDCVSSHRKFFMTIDGGGATSLLLFNQFPCCVVGNDSDGDGVGDCSDLCPGTPTGQSVDGNGCSCSQLDSDGDGVNNCNDQCPGTPTGQSVNESGCSCSQLVSDCDDDNVCNGTETCEDGECVAGTPLNCNDGSACTTDTCDPVSGCAHQSISCDDGNVCTDDSCNPATGCVHTNNTASCNDGNPCTTSDSCANGTCAGTPVSCPEGQTCDPADGQCKAATQTVTFQNGLNGYAGTADTFLRQQASTTNYGADPSLRWDTEESGASTPIYSLIRFDNIFGTGSNQIPPHAQINSATLTYTIGGDSSPEGSEASLHELRVAFNESQVTYANFGGDAGVQSDEYISAPVATVTSPSVGTYSVNVLSSLQAWVGDPTQNLGWIIVPTGSDGVRARSSEYSTSTERPKLTVHYVDGCTADSDGDGVNDCDDVCASTPSGQSVDGNGCSCSQLDSDGDGVNDCNDQCPGTPTGQSVNGNGCSCSQLDSDGDGVNDCNDQCPGTSTGQSVDGNGCSCGQLDSDADGISNCIDECLGTPPGEVVNADGCGCSQLSCDDGDRDTIDECMNGQCFHGLGGDLREDVLDSLNNGLTPSDPSQSDQDALSTGHGGGAGCGAGGNLGGFGALVGMISFQALKTRRKR